MTGISTTSTSKTCPHCGKLLEAVVNPIDKTSIVGYLNCRCEGAVAERRAAEEAERAKLHADKVERHELDLTKSGMPKRYWDVPSDDTYLSDVENGGLFICGLVGRGKTYLASATMRAWMRKHGSFGIQNKAVFTDSNELFSCIRQSYDEGDSEREAMWRYMGCGLLIFDDFGKGRPSEWSLGIIEQLVNHRYNEMLPTIFTSQWSGRELVQRLAVGGGAESAEAIVSRIIETCRVIKLDGPDRRVT